MRCKRRIFPLASTHVRTFLLAPSRNFRHDNPVTSIRQRDSKDDPWRQKALYCIAFHGAIAVCVSGKLR